MLRHLLAPLAFLLVLGIACAQPPLYEPPQGFYKARGNPVVATWSVDRTTLPEDGALVAMLTIDGATNPKDVIRPDLAKLRQFADRFQIENVPGPGDRKSLTFTYRLRPRNAKVDRLPTLEFWYDSGVKVGNPFKKTTAKGIDITVTAVTKAKPPTLPLLEPDRLFVLEEAPAVLAKPPFKAGWPLWVALFLLGIVAAACWYVVWRNLYPNGARLAKLRRNRALRRAMHAIDRADRMSDPAGAVATAVIGYLRSRCPLPAGCETPADASEAVAIAGIAGSVQVQEFLRRCDEARFSTTSDTGVSLADAARLLLARLEAAE